MRKDIPITPSGFEPNGKKAAALFPVVYDELRRLAAIRMANERPNQTLNATALVHEAYLRLAGPGDQSRWESRSHFFAAAAESMRRILIDAARRKKATKRAAPQPRLEIDPDKLPMPPDCPDVLAVNDALEKLAETDPQAAELVKLRYFAGLTIPEAAEVLGISPRTADSWWAYARAWLLAELKP
jgi:RNA polymerase sigma factor (TIGR02999 family)